MYLIYLKLNFVRIFSVFSLENNPDDTHINRLVKWTENLWQLYCLVTGMATDLSCRSGQKRPSVPRTPWLPHQSVFLWRPLPTVVHRTTPGIPCIGKFQCCNSLSLWVACLIGVSVWFIIVCRYYFFGFSFVSLLFKGMRIISGMTG
jgi:hypothetical protein